MDTPTSASGWEDLLGAYSGAGLPIPPIPEGLRSELDRLDEWLWATRAIERWDLYNPGAFLRAVTFDGPDSVAIAHTGHGVNSYFLTYQAFVGPVALFAQVGWGGIYMDNASRVAELAGVYQQIEDLLAAAASWSPAGRAGQRLVVIWGRAKGFDTCAWVTLDEEEQPHLLDWPPGWRTPGGFVGPTALQRAASMLRGTADAVEATIALDWVHVGEVKLTDDGLEFPGDLPTGPGLYRFSLVGTGETRVYIGEASAPRRRASHYRIVHPTGATNARLHVLLSKHLSEGGRVRMAIATHGMVTVEGKIRQADFRVRSTRVMAESAALLSLRDGEVPLNRRGAVGE
jgi:hypothetical protein